jgi:hypothetical protein
MDANENINGTSATSLRATMADLGLFDALEYANPGLTWKSTMQNGTDTIDYLFITHGLKQFVIQAGEMARHETNTADHPALFLDLNGKEALSNDFDTIYNFGQNQRKLWISDRKAVHEYVKILEQLFTDNCIQQRLTALNKTHSNQWTTTQSTKYDTLDQHITRLVL